MWNDDKLDLDACLSLDIDSWYMVHNDTRSAICDWILEDRKHPTRSKAEKKLKGQLKLRKVKQQ